MPEAKWTNQAEADLEEIAFDIAFQDGRPLTADRIVEEIHQKANTYAEQPEMGKPSPELGEGIRTFTHKRWAIIYDLVEGGIRVRAVVDSARDYPGWRP